MFLPSNAVGLGRFSCLHLNGLHIVTVTMKGLGQVCSVGTFTRRAAVLAFYTRMNEEFYRDGNPAPLHVWNLILYHGMLWLISLHSQHGFEEWLIGNIFFHTVCLWIENISSLQKNIWKGIYGSNTIINQTPLLFLYFKWLGIHKYAWCLVVKNSVYMVSQNVVFMKCSTRLFFD